MVLQMDPLMLLMKANLRVPCLYLDLEKKLVLNLLLLMVLMKELGWVLQMATLMIITKENLRFPGLDLDLEKQVRYQLLLQVKIQASNPQVCLH